MSITIEIFKALFCIFALYFVIGLLWQLAELIVYKQVTPRVIDDVIAFLLAMLIYLHTIN